MATLPLFPITIDTIHEDQLDCLIIEGEMIRTFGYWTKGQRLTLAFDLIKGTCTEFDNEGNEAATVRINPLTS